MSNKLQSLRGTKDLLPEAFSLHEYIINTARKIGELYNYKAMSTPILEYTNVFDRTLGDTSDVVSKEMYSFLDKSGESVSLRPEFTAGIIRAFISNGLTHQLPLKFFSHGPVFRYDRPQAGRQRQFHQINFEYIGAEGAVTDAETIKLAQDILSHLGLMDDITLELNSLGDSESRGLYQKKLVEYFTDHKDSLSEDSLKRLEKNPMRILDSKDEGDQKLNANAPLIGDCYSDAAKRYFDNVLQYLDALKVPYVINPRLVRGLDYYCHTAFEFTTKTIGAQSTVLAGGRYDGLSSIMGGPEVPAIGFAAGVERLALMAKYEASEDRYVAILPLSENDIAVALEISDYLRQEGLKAVLDVKGKLDKRLARALEKNAQYAIFIGEEERVQQIYKVKDLDNRQEHKVRKEELLSVLR